MKAYLENEKNEQSKKRQAQLFGLGLAKTTYGFCFAKKYYVAAYSIENMSAHDWSKYLESITNHVNEIKENHNATSTNEEKIKDFIKELRLITGPNIIDNSRLEDIVNGAIFSLQEMTNYIEEEVAGC